ncbi:hypothetical protein SteCoe_30176 [Stentor coeruleus]|uniref:Transmembrane protein n=1 Tax=Stentor coeruleus TaxID=5963 RepID=A0A1R2B457_9CILI|nr:hypothetical protein SteCoe_30176 [Stentor coeruleus]
MERFNTASKEIISNSMRVRLQRKNDWENLIKKVIQDPEKIEACDREIMFMVNAKYSIYSLIQGLTIGTFAYHGYKCFSMTPVFWTKMIFSMYLIIPIISYFGDLKKHNIYLKDILSYKYKHLLIND